MASTGIKPEDYPPHLTAPQHDAVIFYSQKDRDKANALCERLIRLGQNVALYDDDSFLDWKKTLEFDLVDELSRRATYKIFVIAEGLVNDHNINFHKGEAITESLQKGDGSVLPVFYIPKNEFPENSCFYGWRTMTGLYPDDSDRKYKRMFDMKDAEQRKRRREEDQRKKLEQWIEDKKYKRAQNVILEDMERKEREKQQREQFHKQVSEVPTKVRNDLQREAPAAGMSSIGGNMNPEVLKQLRYIANNTGLTADKLIQMAVENRTQDQKQDGRYKDVIDKLNEVLTANQMNQMNQKQLLEELKKAQESQNNQESRDTQSKVVVDSKARTVYNVTLHNPQAPVIIGPQGQTSPLSPDIQTDGSVSLDVEANPPQVKPLQPTGHQDVKPKQPNKPTGQQKNIFAHFAREDSMDADYVSTNPKHQATPQVGTQGTKQNVTPQVGPQGTPQNETQYLDPQGTIPKVVSANGTTIPDVIPEADNQRNPQQPVDMGQGHIQGTQQTQLPPFVELFPSQAGMSESFEVSNTGLQTEERPRPHISESQELEQYVRQMEELKKSDDQETEYPDTTFSGDILSPQPSVSSSGVEEPSWTPRPSLNNRTKHLNEAHNATNIHNSNFPIESLKPEDYVIHSDEEEMSITENSFAVHGQGGLSVRCQPQSQQFQDGSFIPGAMETDMVESRHRVDGKATIVRTPELLQQGSSSVTVNSSNSESAGNQINPLSAEVETPHQFNPLTAGVETRPKTVLMHSDEQSLPARQFQDVSKVSVIASLNSSSLSSPSDGSIAQSTMHNTTDVNNEISSSSNTEGSVTVKGVEETCDNGSIICDEMALGNEVLNSNNEEQLMSVTENSNAETPSNEGIVYYDDNAPNQNDFLGNRTGTDSNIIDLTESPSTGSVSITSSEISVPVHYQNHNQNVETEMSGTVLNPGVPQGSDSGFSSYASVPPPCGNELSGVQDPESPDWEGTPV